MPALAEWTATPVVWSPMAHSPPQDWVRSAVLYTIHSEAPMRLIRRYAVLALAAVFCSSSTLTIAYQSDRPTDGYWRCFSAPDRDPIYFTGVWEQRVLATEVRDGFARFLADKYGYTGRVSCSTSIKGPSDLAKAKSDSLELQKHYQKSGMKVIDTGWTLPSSTAPGTPGQAAPAAAAAPAPGAPTHWAACRIDRLPPGASAVNGPYNVYLSEVFPFDPKTLDLVKTFGEFISVKFGRERDNPLCNVRTSEESVRAMHKTWIGEANKIGKVIMTGWKYPGK